ncbi:ATP synthase subunit I [Oceanobacillus halophilus]|uniref:ATP synthase subunit I n=1 Tax=Oceanobacillus halophilus TaxID=930130 RepID=A0A495A4A6_9BACI|nr:ATP synthase subunit I [Oceanobacillus halophilus]RKQ34378.1 ATP synthase subunit I [Oceanobacillus halophilus]
MSEYESMIRRQRKWMLYLLAILVLGTGFTPYTEIFNGLILGTVISFYNLWLLQQKTNAFGKSVAESGTARGGLGVFSRLAAAAIGVLLALRFPEIFHIMAVAIGILSSYLIILFDMLIVIITQKKKPNNS